MIIEKKFLPLQPFVIAINGLKQGSTQFDWRADAKFFGNFENSDILDASLDLQVQTSRNTGYLGVECNIKGSVEVVCDRCLENLTLPVDTSFRLSVKFSAAGSEDGEGIVRTDCGDMEIVMLPEGEAELDLSQFIYDYVCTSLPMRRVHPEGECNPSATRYLNSEETAEDSAAAQQSPFAALKDMLK